MKGQSGARHSTAQNGLLFV